MLTLQEKIQVRGIESLSDVELLALLLDGDSQESLLLAERLLGTYHSSLVSLSSEELPRLRMAEGIGVKSALRLKASAEWGRRVASLEGSEQQTITTSQDVVDIFRPYFAPMPYEECWVLFLSSSNRIIERFRASQGGLGATVVDCRLVIKRALELLSTQIVLVHNHPSGNAEPSRDDIEVTQKIKSAAALFDINLIDHIIITKSTYFSLLASGLL